MNKEELERLCSIAELTYDTYSPGDGRTRYKIMNESLEYFASKGLITVLSIREACIFLEGYIAGKEGIK